MKKIIIYLIIILSCPAGYAQVDRSVRPEAGPAPEIKIGDYETFELKNGLKVIVVENHKLPRVSFSLIIDRDPILEKDKVGYVSMAGQMLRRGTENRTKDQIDEEIDFIGASLSTGANSIYASSLTKHQDKLLEIMTDILFRPVFPEEELAKVKKQTLSEIASQKDAPEAIARNVARAVLYSKDHPYGEIQREEHVENINRQDLQDYYQTYFKPNISYLAIVGDIRPKEAKKIVKKYFSEWEMGEVPEHEYEQPEAPGQMHVALVDRPASVQTVLDLSYPVYLEKGHPDVIKSNVMNQILGGSSASRLFKNIREEKGYTYGAYSSLVSDELVGNFSAGASVRTEVTDSAIVEFINEFRRIRENKVSDNEITVARNVLIGSFGRSLENPQTVASFAINIQRYGLPEDYYNTYVKKVEEVSAADVQEMAEKYIRSDNLYIIAVGKGSGIDDKLRKFGPITYYDAYGNEIDPTRAKLPDGLNADKVISNYIEAIGGQERLLDVNDIKYELAADVMGNQLAMDILKKDPNLMKVEVKMGDNVVSSQVFNGENAKMVQMGNEIEADEKMLERLRIEGYLFPELNYDELGVTTDLTGMENIDGQNAYAIQVTYPSGKQLQITMMSIHGIRLGNRRLWILPRGKSIPRPIFQISRKRMGSYFLTCSRFLWGPICR
jgi:zinc protease